MCIQNGKPRRYCRTCAAGTLIQLSRLRYGIKHYQGFQQISPTLTLQKRRCLQALRRWGAPEFAGSEGVEVVEREDEKRGADKRGRGRPRKTGFH